MVPKNIDVSDFEKASVAIGAFFPIHKGYQSLIEHLNTLSISSGTKQVVFCVKSQRSGEINLTETQAEDLIAACLPTASVYFVDNIMEIGPKLLECRVYPVNAVVHKAHKDGYLNSIKTTYGQYYADNNNVQTTSHDFDNSGTLDSGTTSGDIAIAIDTKNYPLFKSSMKINSDRKSMEIFKSLQPEE